MSPLGYVDAIPSEEMVHGSGYVSDFWYFVVKASMVDMLF